NLKKSFFLILLLQLLFASQFLPSIHAGEMTKNFIIKGQGVTIYGPGSLSPLFTDSNKNMIFDSTGTIYIYDSNFEKIIDYLPKGVDFIYDCSGTDDDKYILFEEASTLSCFDIDACKILWREKLELKNKSKIKWKIEKRRIRDIHEQHISRKHVNLFDYETPSFCGVSYYDSKYYYNGDFDKGEIIIGDLMTGKKLYRWNVGEKITQVGFSTEEIGVITVLGEIEHEKSIQRRNFKDGEIIWNYDYPARDIAISKDKKNIFLCHKDKGVAYLDIMTGKVLWEGKQVVVARHAKYDESSRFVITYDDSEAYLYIWDTNDGSVYYTELKYYEDVEPSDDGRYIILVEDRDIKLFDILKKETVWESKLDKYIYSVCFSVDMKYIYANCEGSVIKYLSTLTGKETKSIEISPIADNDLGGSEISPDGQFAVFDGDGLFLKNLKDCSIVWQKFTKAKYPEITKKYFSSNFKDEQYDAYFRARYDNFTCAAFSHDGEKIACNMIPGIIKVRDTKSGSQKWSVKEHDPEKGKKCDIGAINDISFSNNDSKIAYCCEKGMVKVLNSENGEILWQAKKHKESVNGVTFSYNDQYLLSCGDEGEMICYSAENGKVQWTAKVDDKECKLIKASPTESKFAVISRNLDKKELLIEMRNLSDGSILWSKNAKLENEWDRTRENLAYAPKGDKVAYSYQNEIVILDVNLGGEIKRITVYSWYYEFSNAILGLAFDKDGRHIYTTLHDGSARKFDL
ncbi:PQQ-binding-like beta-propeller repeat protein, partial [bacterium]|nr:PQQ-binding-like beta-propeller repeat protein [bacterium]